jgi:CheY-like chemotaxis protein
MRSSKPILLIEDNTVDALAVMHTLADLKVANRIIHTRSGKTALEHLKNPENEKPCIILLDLGLPDISGIEFLKTIRNDRQLGQIPVIVLTASEDEHDILESFQLSVAGYVVKRSGYNDLMDIFKTINLYWTLSELPVGG